MPVIEVISRKRMPEVRKAFCCNWMPSCQYKIEDESHGRKQQAGNGHLRGKKSGQDEQKEDDHPQIDDPEGCLLEQGGQADRFLLHQG